MREYQAHIRGKAIDTQTQMMECHEHGLIPAVVLEKTLHWEDDYSLGLIVSYLSFRFRISWVTVRCRNERCMAKAVMCNPEYVPTIQA